LCPFNPKVFYQNFLADGAKQGVNVGSEIFEKAHGLAAADDWSNPDWLDVYSNTQNVAARLIKDGPLDEFWKSDFFMAHHVKNGGDEADEYEEVPDTTPVSRFQLAANKFGIKNVAALQKIMTVYEKVGEARSLKAFEALLKVERKQMKARDFIRLLIKRGYMKESAVQPPAAAPVQPPAAPPVQPQQTQPANNSVSTPGSVGSVGQAGSAAAVNPAAVTGSAGATGSATAAGSAGAVDPAAATGSVGAQDAGQAAITLDKKQLRMCEFENLKDLKHLERIRSMVGAYLADDLQKAKLMFEKVQKEEPATSFIRTVPLKDLMKLMAKKQAYVVEELVA
jgi:hypothetical protein